MFLICLWLPRLELFLNFSYFGPTIEAGCSYKMVLIQDKLVLTEPVVLFVAAIRGVVEFEHYLFITFDTRNKCEHVHRRF